MRDSIQPTILALCLAAATSAFADERTLTTGSGGSPASATAKLETVDFAPLQLPPAPLVPDTFSRDLHAVCQRLAQESVRSETLGISRERWSGAMEAALRDAVRDEAKAQAAVKLLGNLVDPCRRVGLLTPSEDDLTLFRELRWSGKFPAITAMVESADEGFTKFLPPGAQQSGLTGAAEWLGGFEERLLKGLTTFVAKRAKQEAIGYLSTRMREELCKEERKHLFENVCATLLSVADGSMTLTAMSAQLQASAEADLRRLPDRVAVLGMASTTKASNERDLLVTLRILTTFHAEVVEGRSPLELSRAIHRVKYDCLTNADAGADDRRFDVLLGDAPGCGPLIRTLAIGSTLLEALQRQTGLHVVVESPSALNVGSYAVGSLLLFEELHLGIEHASIDERRDRVTARPHAALIAIWARGILPGETVPRPELAFLRALPELVLEVSQLAKDIASLAERPRKDIRVAEVLGIAHRGVQIVSRASAGAAPARLFAGLKPDATLPDVPSILAAPRRLELLAPVGAALVDLARALEAGDPANMLIATRSLGRAAADALGKVHAGSFGIDVSDPQRILDRWAPLIVELANATDADQVARTLEAAAAPVGSHRAKFRQRSAALTALVGGGGGYEWLAGAEELAEGGIAGPMAPIGLHLTTHGRKGRGSYGVLVSAIDLGALVSQRLDSELVTDDESIEISPEPSPRFQQVLSPGLWLTVGFGSRKKPSPFVLGVGASFVPTAREVTLDPDGSGPESGKTTARSAVRAGVFLAVDVTILPF